MYLFDSDILIDYLRLHKPAIQYLDKLEKRDRNIAFITQFELLKGCNKKSQAQKISSFLKNFQILPLNEAISKKALQIFRDIKWHSSIDIPDTFIAASALVHGKLTLVTRNIKHYRSIETLKIEKPY